MAVSPERQIKREARKARLQIQRSAEEAREAQRVSHVVPAREGDQAIISGGTRASEIERWKQEELAGVGKWEAESLRDVSAQRRAAAAAATSEATYAGLTAEEQDIVRDYGIDEVNRRRRLTAEEEAVAGLKDTSVRLPDGTWVDRAAYEAMPQVEQAKLREMGLDVYNASLEKAKAAAVDAAARFEQENVKVVVQGEEKWVPRSEWDGLTSSQQVEVQKTGSYTVHEAPTVGASQDYALPSIEKKSAEVPPTLVGFQDTPLLNVDRPRNFWEQLTPWSENKGETVQDVALEALTFGQYQTPTQLRLEYRQAAREAEAEGMVLVDEEGNELTERAYVEERTKEQPSFWEAGREWIPGAQFFIPGRMQQLVSEGPVGVAKLVGYTALDVAMVVPFVGWAAKGASALFKVATVGGKVAVAGGKVGARAAAEAALKKVAATEVEVATKQTAVKTAERGLAKAMRTMNAADVSNWQKALGIARKELADAVVEHGPRVAAAKVELATATRLMSAAEKATLATRAAELGYRAGIRTTALTARIAKPAMYTFGGITLGTTAVEWRELSPLQRGMNIGMVALAFGAPGKVLKTTRNIYEIARYPGRIPRRSIEVPGTYLPGDAGMPKTPVGGMSAREQLRAIETSSAALERLWGGEGKVKVPWPGERGLTYAPRAEFQRVVPKSMISATPMGSVFERGVYEVVAVREPAQFFSTWGFPQFTEASAAGVKGPKASPTYLSLFSSEMKKFPKGIAEAPTPEVMRGRAEAWYKTGAEPGTYPGYKLYKGWKEPEFTVPVESQVGEAVGGIPLWTRTAEGTKVQIKPYYMIEDELARRTGFTLREAFGLKRMGPGLELQAVKEALTPKRGIAGERGFLADLRSGLRELRGTEKELSEEITKLRAEKAPKEKVRAFEERLKIVKEDVVTGEARLKTLEARAERLDVRSLRTTTGRVTGETLARGLERVTSEPRLLTSPARRGVAATDARAVEGLRRTFEDVLRAPSTRALEPPRVERELFRQAIPRSTYAPVGRDLFRPETLRGTDRKSVV